MLGLEGHVKGGLETVALAERQCWRCSFILLAAIELSGTGSPWWQ